MSRTDSNGGSVTGGTEAGAVDSRFVRWFDTVSSGDVAEVGGKNASLGELRGTLVKLGIAVPNGFATTAEAFREHFASSGLGARVAALLSEAKAEGRAPSEAGSTIREAIRAVPLPDAMDRAVREAYRTLCVEAGVSDLPVAVRSSATAEDLPEASFAGQQDSFLNVRGEDAVVAACLSCHASLYTDRAIAYRERLGFDHTSVALSVGVQRMVGGVNPSAGVMFTLDPESGFPGVAVVSAAWGFGEAVVQGIVDPDRFMIFKALLGEEGCEPILEHTIGAKHLKVVSGEKTIGVRKVETTAEERAGCALSRADALQLADWGCAIESHYGMPMDIEWTRDGGTGEIFVVQARPETVWARKPPTIERVRLLGHADTLITGHPVGTGVASGPVQILMDPTEAGDFVEGSVLVAPRTDPDWGPLLREAAAVVTDHGGSTSHAAIVCRELGIPAIVGARDATARLVGGMQVTVSCVETPGVVMEGVIPFECISESFEDVEDTRLAVMMNVATPTVALRSWALPVKGVGLARLEFLISEVIRAHPMALVSPERLGPDDAETVRDMVRGFPDPAEFFVSNLANGIAKIAAVVHPHPAVVRTSDLKSNEYATLIGGSVFERHEENPMIGFRGASRYVSPDYRPAFELECEAIRRVRDEIGLRNVIPMIPFCRTLEEADEVLEIMAECGLRRGERGLAIYVMCEVPSNVVLATDFAARFDGFSIGSNDLTQLTLGADRDNAALSTVFDASNPAVTALIEQVIRDAHASGRPVGFCGQAPSDDPAYAGFLLHAGIDSVSVDPHSVPGVLRHIAAVERTTSA